MIIKTIQNYLNKRKLEKQVAKRIENRKKYYEIRGAVIKFYEHKDLTEGSVDIPAFIRADKILKEVVKTPADIDFYYKKLLKYKVA
jgi:hypothetical protein